MKAVTALDSSSESDGLPLRAILSSLSDEIGRPLNLLHQGIDALLARHDEPLTEAERDQAATMLTLCDEIDRLTRDYFGTTSQPGS